MNAVPTPLHPALSTPKISWSFTPSFPHNLPDFSSDGNLMKKMTAMIAEALHKHGRGEEMSSRTSATLSSHERLLEICTYEYPRARSLLWTSFPRIKQIVIRALHAIIKSVAKSVKWSNTAYLLILKRREEPRDLPGSLDRRCGRSSSSLRGSALGCWS